MRRWDYSEISAEEEWTVGKIVKVKKSWKNIPGSRNEVGGSHVLLRDPVITISHPERGYVEA